MAFQIHGRTYRYVADVWTRYRELTEQIRTQGFNSDGIETERVLLREWLNANVVNPPEQYFYAYYRTAKGGKGYRRFKTRKGLSNFLATTDHAVTAHN
jgi:hypothetical protein